MMEGFDRCKLRDPRAGKRVRTTPAYRETTTELTTTTTTTERVTTPEIIDNNGVLKLPFVDESEISEEGSSYDTIEPDEKTVRSGCEDLKHGGGATTTKVYKVGVTRYNEAGRDFNTRLCDQETSGGGWTVGILRYCVLLSLLLCVLSA